MVQNRVDVSLTPEDKADIMTAINTIRQKLPFLIDLSPTERQQLPKMSDKSEAFVTKALEVARQNPQILPRAFDVEEMERDVTLYQTLRPITLALTQLQELVDDTTLAAGSEAYTAALLVYQYAKVSNFDGGLDDVLDELGQRFARKSSSKANPAA